MVNAPLLIEAVGEAVEQDRAVGRNEDLLADEDFREDAEEFDSYIGFEFYYQVQKVADRVFNLHLERDLAPRRGQGPPVAQDDVADLAHRDAVDDLGWVLDVVVAVAGLCHRALEINVYHFGAASGMARSIASISGAPRAVKCWRRSFCDPLSRFHLWSFEFTARWSHSAQQGWLRFEANRGNRSRG